MRAESVSPKVAADLVGASVSTLKLAAERGDLHVYREHGSRVYLRGEVIEWAKARGLLR